MLTVGLLIVGALLIIFLIFKVRQTLRKWRFRRAYRKATQQGDVYAQMELGGMYTLGEGVDIDFTQAEYWYRRAAEQGYDGAFRALDSLREHVEFYRRLRGH